MSDFVSGFWSYYIALITLAGVIGCALFLRSNRTGRQAKGEPVDTTGHVWDEDLKEWNNPLPRWWSWLFYITIIFALVYLALYPGLGSYSGAFGWSSQKQYHDEVAKAEQEYGPIFNKFLQQDLRAVAANPEARQMGQRLFLTYCSQCHGSDATGGRGFPNLTDNDWLYGGEPETIKTTIMNGRNGVMPPMADAIGGDAHVEEVANYVLSLSGEKHDAVLAEKGKEKFAVCAACHGPDGKGNQAIGAPNLTDRIWLHSASQHNVELIKRSIIETITKGRNNVMPSWKDFLGEAKVHLLAAYVYGLSQGQK